MVNWDSYLEPDWVNDSEWDEDIHLDCEQEVAAHPEGVACNDNCAPEDNAHACGFSDEVNMSCVGQETYTAYYICPWCKHDDYIEKDGRDF